MTLDEFLENKRRFEEVRKQATKVEAKLEQLMETLQKEHECQNIKEAKEKVREMEKERVKLQKKYEYLDAAFKEKWKDKLDIL
jgi:hypothetical protein